MSDISRRLEQVVSKELAKTIIPVKTDAGILVGKILIVNEGSIKNILQDSRIIYNSVFLNAIAIKLAHLLNYKNTGISCDKIYNADQEYGKWFIDSQMLRTRYQTAVASQDHDKADIFWARYCESRDRAIVAKNHAESLVTF